MPRVSVVIPTYNHRNYILETLDSVFQQTVNDYEVIVVNDGSPDDTAAVLRPLIDAGRIKYVEQKNNGQAAARNRGLESATGDYVAFLDDDDQWPPDKLAWQTDILDNDPECVLVYGEYQNQLPDGTTTAPAPMPRPQGWVRDEFILACRIMSPGQTLIRRDTLNRVGGFDTKIWGADDWDLYIRLAEYGTFRYEPQVALLYRVHDTNASRNALVHVQNHLNVARRHIGSNRKLWRLHFREAANYFVPNLLRYGETAHYEGRYADALRAYRYAAKFRPRLLIDRAYWRRAVAAALRSVIGPQKTIGR